MDIQDPAQEIADKVIAHEESYKLYSTNGTVTILRTGTPRSYSFTLYAQRPDHYYLSWADANGNITDIFITTGWDEYIIHSSFNETQHFQKGFGTSTKYIRHDPHRRMTAGYDILELVTSPLREGRDNVPGISLQKERVNIQLFFLPVRSTGHTSPLST